MAILQPSQLDFSGKYLNLILSGGPGVGKTSTAFSAQKVLLFDADHGVCRVRPEHRQAMSAFSSFEQLLADIEAARKSGLYSTFVFDTVGAVIDLMKAYIIANPSRFPKGARASGGLSQAGYGYLKNLFLEFSANVRRDHDTIFIFHEQKAKDEDIAVYEILCEGSAKNLVFQPADLAGHLFISNGKRYVSFTPTENYYAKSAYGVSGTLEIPELTPGKPNTFLTDLFTQVRQNLKVEAETFRQEDAAYQAVMQKAQEMVDGVKDATGANQAFKEIQALDHVLTSKTECWDLLKKHAEGLGLKWDGRKKEFSDGGTD